MKFKIFLATLISGSILALGLFFVYFSYQHYRLQKDMQTWISIPAMVTGHVIKVSEAGKNNPATYTCVLNYSYQINNQRIISSSDSTEFGEDRPARFLQDQAISDCNESQLRSTINVFYNPKDTKISVVKKRTDVGDIALSSYLGFFCVFMGLASVFIFYHTLKKKKV